MLCVQPGLATETQRPMLLAHLPCPRQLQITMWRSLLPWSTPPGVQVETSSTNISAALSLLM